MKRSLNTIIKDYNRKIKFLLEYSNYREINSKAAEISFYLLLSIFPFLIFTISLVVYTPIINISKYIFLLKKIIPNSAFNIVTSLIRSAIENRSIHFLFFSFILAMYTMSRAVIALIRGMNKSYNIRETRPYLEVLFMSLIFVIMLVVFIVFFYDIFSIWRKVGIFYF